MEQLNDLIKALEAGSYNAAPSSLVQGSALQVEHLDPIMHNATWSDKQIKLQKMFPKESVKTTLVQFNRQLDYGTFGGSAQYEGGLGEEDTSTFVRSVMLMSYYSTTRRVSLAANMVQSFDGQKAEDRSAQDASMKLTGDIEFDSFRGQEEFSNAGVFDGNPAVLPSNHPGMMGLNQQIRFSDSLSNSQDLMFAEYGSDQSVVLPVNGPMTQSFIEDGAVRSNMNQGQADTLVMDPISLSQYNKIAFAKERILLAGSPQESTGAQLRQQWTSFGGISLESSRFLAGKTQPARARAGSPAAPSLASAAAGSDGILDVGSYSYYVTAVSIRGESAKSSSVSQAVLAAQHVALTIGAVSGASHFNVYRSKVGGSAASAKFIGRVKAASSGSTSFIDLGNRSPGSVSCYLIQKDTAKFNELAGFSRLKLAVSDLSLPEAFFTFQALTAHLPRKNVIFENVSGQLS